VTKKTQGKQTSFNMLSASDVNAHQLDTVSSRQYIQPLIKNIDSFLKDQARISLSDTVAAMGLLDSLSEIMRNSEAETVSIIYKNKGLTDARQSIKSTAGNNFQAAVAYSLIKIQHMGVIPSNIAISLSGTFHTSMKASLEIVAGGETQKPDADIIICDPCDEETPIILLSAKTSLRERGGQTAKWKLLIDIARSNNCTSLKVKYGLSNNTEKLEILRRVTMGVVTTDLYEEINAPQIRGLEKLLDYFYVTKGTDKGFSGIIQVLNESFSKRNQKTE